MCEGGYKEGGRWDERTRRCLLGESFAGSDSEPAQAELTRGTLRRVHASSARFLLLPRRDESRVTSYHTPRKEKIHLTNYTLVFFLIHAF